MQLKELCLTLIKCESEKEVIEILKNENYWDDPENWQFFGGDENNYSIIGNQQSKPETAIVEKIINSVDAMLMGECLKNKIKPDGSDAPKDIKQALEKFYKIHDGKLTNISAKERSKQAEDICFVATGQKTNPTYALIDRGEGQSPAKLHDTILSLRKSNKLRIPFVQGKFNMGGTGVFRFCGESNIQLIISRRNPAVATNEGDPTKNYWGFTIVRREDPANGVRSSSYKYLAPSKQILFFEAESIPVIPRAYPEAYGNPLSYGTYLKFFEYKIGPGLRTNILLDLYNRLSLLMPNIALPVKLFERRSGYTGNSFETVLSGLSVRVDEDRSDNIEENFPTSGVLTVAGEKMKYSVYVFKKDKHKNYTGDEGIIFTINGQTHGALSKSFFNRKGVGLSYLADSILVILDCSEINGRERENLFMNSRDRLSTCPLKTEIEKALEEELKSHPGLRILKDKRRQEEIQSKLQDQQPLADILDNILKKSPTLSKLLMQGFRLQNPFNTIAAAANQEVYRGTEFPSFFTLTKKYPPEIPKQAHIGSKFRVEFKTDVRNDYLDRSKDPGTFKLFINGNECNDKSVNLWNGFAHLNVLIGNNYQFGDILTIRCEISDVSRFEPLVEEFVVQVIDPIKKQNTKPGDRKPPHSTEDGNGSKKPDGFSMPQIVEVTRDGRSGQNWLQHSFNEYSALRVKGNEDDGFDFFVNIDNIHLLTELKSASTSDMKAIEAKYKFAMVLIGIALLQGYKQSRNDNNEEENIYVRIENVTQALSPIIIPMIDSLSAIEMENLVSMPEEV